jgi:signal transduction histidine kinase
MVRVALGLVVVASLLVLAAPRTELAPLGIVDPPPMVIAAELAVVLLLLLGVLLSGPAGPQGPATLGLLLAAAVAAGAAVGATRLPNLVSSVAWLLSVTLVPALLQMSLAWPRGWPRRPAEQRLVLATWVTVGLLGLARLTVWDPFTDATCVLGCGDNPLAAHTDPELARALLDALLVVSTAACSVTAALVLRRRRFWVGGIACLTLGVDALIRLATDGPVPQATAVALHQIRCVALVMVGGALAITAWSRLRRHDRLLALAAELDAAPAPGSYEAPLRAALGDPTLRIAFPADEGPAVDGSAGSRPALAEPGRATTVLVRSGVPVAIITHQERHADALAAALGPAARMAIDNERLQSQLRARLDELRASRARIVESSDAERLRLERDLHDGAQQRLLMIGYELERATAADTALARALDPVNGEVHTALEELREIAHGIYPGILESLGLRAALDALADGPAPFQLNRCPDRRFPAPAERAVYRIVSTALLHPQRTGPGMPAPVTASVDLRGDELHLHLTGLGALPAATLQTWEDHVGALGGTITVAGPELKCVLPCG